MSKLQRVTSSGLKKIRHFYTQKASNNKAKLGSKRDRSIKNNHKNIQNKKQFDQQSDYIKWLADPLEGGQYLKPSSNVGTNFIHQKDYPFPLNPKFKPLPPLSLQVRKNIGQKWKEGKSLTEISDMFGISVIRVEAVLRLLTLESKWKQEKRTLDSYAQTMHHMLGSATEQSFNEPQFFVFTPSETQNFTLIDENSEFTPEDAADELQRRLYSDLKEKVIQIQSDTLSNKKYGILNQEQKLQKEIINPTLKKNRFDLKVVDSYTGDIWLLSKGLLKQIK